MAQLASSARSINCMYLEYMNGTPAEPAIPSSRTLDYYAALADPYGYVRTPALFAPEFRTAVEGCENNELMFTGSTGGGAVRGAPLTDGVSVFYSAALLHAPDPLDASQDILFNAFPLKNNGTFATLTKLVRLQVGVRAGIRFGPAAGFPTVLTIGETLVVPAFAGARLYEFVADAGARAYISAGSGNYALFSICNDEGALQVRWGAGTPAERHTFRYAGEKIYLNAPGFAFSMAWTGCGALRFRLEGYDAP